MKEVLVYSPHSSARLQYTLYWVLRYRLGLEFSITESVHEYEIYEGPKINYSNLFINGGMNIDANSILYDTHINEHFGEMGEWNGLKTIFKSTHREVPFDIFGAIFYCISRMEEYGINTTDNFGRYLHSNSVLFKLNVLQTPIVDLWIEAFKIELKALYPALEFKLETFKIINTFDIDQLFCYASKGLKRNIGGGFRDLLSLKLLQVLDRILVLGAINRDPYDTVDYIISKHEALNLETIVFVLLADHSTYDKNISHLNPAFIERLRKLSQHVKLGIHPSFYSSEKPELFGLEMERLKQIQGCPTYNSRQHYLRFNIPDTYRQLIEAGIRQEYSMGYPEITGFRAGTAHPFHWFDMENNEVTLLEIFPCCVMDVTLKNYLNLKPKNAMQVIQHLLQEVKQVNGVFIPIWHNESISNYAEWKGWRAVYESMFSNKTA